MYTDVSSTKGKDGVGCVIVTPEKESLEYALIFNFAATNNETEYEALLTGLLIARGAGARRLCTRSDSKLVVQHVRGEYATKEPQMKA